jgi:hypothetical protein
VNHLAQQALGYVVSQGVFWVASISLVEHRYVLRSKGKLILEDSDRLSKKIEPGSERTESELGKTEPSSGKEKPVLGNANQLPGNVDRLSRKADLEIEPSSGKVEPGPSYDAGYGKSWN